MTSAELHHEYMRTFFKLCTTKDGTAEAKRLKKRLEELQDLMIEQDKVEG